ncbi:hypothetical protein GRAN_1834 [Granulicella sibirica]|uniref:Uncharacterized protein n=1 Tax=Granulicella sibirica TaxID=2479048 RepID=A0A4V1L699_9BACT|nr:hypothetical protein GRAN_1834 [Granulicella sibirica]
MERDPCVPEARPGPHTPVAQRVHKRQQFKFLSVPGRFVPGFRNLRMVTFETNRGKLA